MYFHDFLDIVMFLVSVCFLYYYLTRYPVIEIGIGFGPEIHFRPWSLFWLLVLVFISVSFCVQFFR